MKTRFIPKEAASSRRAFSELEVGQGFRIGHRDAVVYIKISEASLGGNCIAVEGWKMCSYHHNDLVTPVDLELKEL